MCGRKRCKVVRCETILLDIEKTVHEHARQLQSICLGLKNANDRVISDARKLFRKGIKEFFVGINRFLREMKELYLIFSECSLETSDSLQEVKLEDIMDSLLDNLKDILQFMDSNGTPTSLIEGLEGNIRFLKNFILLAICQGLQHRQLEDLLSHIEGLIVNGARLTFMCRYGDNPQMNHVNELTRRIKPTEYHICKIYVKVLQDVSLGSLLSSHPTTPGSQRPVFRDFVDSLIFILWELLSIDNSCADTFSHHLQELFGDLTFLRFILRVHQKKLDELYEKLHDLIKVVVCEAGILVCYLFLQENEGGIDKELNILFLEFKEKFKLIKVEEKTQKFSFLKSSKFPQTDMMRFIDSVLEKLKFPNPNEADSAALAKSKFRTIHRDLAFLRSFLVDVTLQCDQNEKLQALQNRIVVVAYETEFVLDSLEIGDAIQDLLVLVDTIIEEIKLIKNEALETFHSKRQTSKVQNIVKTNSVIPSTGEIPLLDESVVGMEDEAETIISQLTRGTKQLDIFSIVGMPGLGKTTLTEKIYNDPSIVLHFHVRSWCCVSQVYSKRSLLLEILSGVIDDILDHREDDLAEVLYKNLKGKRYLIILDDLWDTSAWNSLRSSFPNDCNGSRILLTSRLHDVASQIKPDREPHNLRSLNKDESWELMQKKINNLEGCPPALISLGMEIAELCKGLPLMILIVAGILSNTNNDTWSEVAEGLRKGTLSTSEQCLQTLELSYSHLPDYLKSCFLYFGAFQADLRIRARELLWLWIAEGFVERTGKVCLQRVAEGYLLELIQRNLVIVSEKGLRGKVKYCAVHNLLHDFCMAKGNEEYFLRCLKEYDLGTSIETNTSYRLLVLCKIEDIAESRVLSPRLRSLFFRADYEERYARNWYNILYNLCQSRLLRVLDLRRINVGSFFPRVIESLVHLRYLGLSIEAPSLTIPSSIGKLSNLETFILERCRGDVSLPDTVWNMKLLQHLCLTGALGCWKFPTENPDASPNLANLETLSTVVFLSDHTMKEILRKSPNIRRLNCNLGATGDTGDCMILALDFMTQLESLTINQIPHDFHYLHLELPWNLKKLVISNFHLPWSKISVIGNLPNLEVLKLLKSAFVGKIWDLEEGSFPKLRFLKLAGLHLARWNWSESEDHFPCLNKLVLEGCRYLEEIPSALAYVSTLQTIEVFGCKSATSSVEIFKKTLMDMGNEDLKIIIQPTRRKRY
ncbi:OLC1v1019125C3 [Oldenlandia corymbosa var. corymbosa]|nr:OLC1v1019125C3 [Oldenlandia corymbosa var. corymbosa]